jgi:ATP adenylyltransferase
LRLRRLSYWYRGGQNVKEDAQRRRKKDACTRRLLWAPWRLQYICAPKNGTCFLCEKAKGNDASNHVIARGRKVFVLLNAFPYNSGHLLVAPYRHVADLAELDIDELTELMTLTVKAELVMNKALRPQGFNIGFNLGEAAGAGLADHVHGHIVPRWVGDTNFMPVLGNTRVVPQALEQTAKLLRVAWTD